MHRSDELGGTHGSICKKILGYVNLELPSSRVPLAVSERIELPPPPTGTPRHRIGFEVNDESLHRLIISTPLNRLAIVFPKTPSQDTDLSFLLNEFTQAQYMASRFDPHPSPAVHRRIGDELAAYVLKNHFRFEKPLD